MSDDRREKILLRIVELLAKLVEGEDPSINVYRDVAELEQAELPAFVLLDGTETKQASSGDRRDAYIMMLEPQIFYVPMPTKTAQNTGMGPKLSAMRSKMIKLFMTDYKLQELVGTNGYVEYRGMETDMQTGGEVKGQYRMYFGIAYYLNFSKL